MVLIFIHKVILKEMIDMVVVLKGDKSSDYGTVYSLMLQLKANGIDKVSFSSENPN